jgi:hypothetical protein
MTDTHARAQFGPGFAMYGRGWRRPSWPRPGLLWFGFDLIAPTVLLYVLIWGGASLYAALLASASVSAVSALVSYWRGGSNGRFAPYMLAMALASFAIALVTGSDRFLLAKESVLTALVGCWFLASIWSERPLTYRFTRPLLEGRIGRGGAPWEVLWTREPRFRRIWRVSSAMWAGVTLIDAVIRVVMAYTLPVNVVPAMQTGLLVATTLLMQVVTNVYYLRAGLWPLVHRPYVAPPADS